MYPPVKDEQSLYFHLNFGEVLVSIFFCSCWRSSLSLLSSYPVIVFLVSLKIIIGNFEKGFQGQESLNEVTWVRWSDGIINFFVNWLVRQLGREGKGVAT